MDAGRYGRDLLLLGGGGIDGGGTASKRGFGSGPQHRRQEEQDMVKQQLNQICMLMEMEQHEHEHEHAAPPGPSSSSSSTLLSFSGTGSLNENSISSLMPTPASTITTLDDNHRGQFCYDSNLDHTIQNLEEFMCQQAHVHHNLAKPKNGHGGDGDGDGRSAFRPYTAWNRGPKMNLTKPGAGGQRAIKSAMAVLAKMHKANLALWQCYQMEKAAATGGSSCNQMQQQHVLSERKRREKLNDSFKALRTVLPPAAKKDKASILIRARDYVTTLNSRISELEEKNRMLVESQLLHDDYSGNQDDDDDSGEMVKVDIRREPAAEETSKEFHLMIAVSSGCKAMDAVVAILHYLKDFANVRLVAMDTGSHSAHHPPGNAFQQTSITLQMKQSCRCNDDFMKESIIRTIKGVMQSKIETT